MTDVCWFGIGALGYLLTFVSVFTLSEKELPKVEDRITCAFLLGLAWPWLLVSAILILPPLGICKILKGTNK